MLNIYNTSLMPKDVSVPGLANMISSQFKISNFSRNDNAKISLEKRPYSPFIIPEVFTPEECAHIIEVFKKAGNMQPVSVYGLKEFSSEEIGSYRTTGWCPTLSKILFSRINKYLDVLYMDEYLYTDFYQKLEYPVSQWSPHAVSPMMRYMEYSNGGQHFAHCDAGYIYEDPLIRTLYSVVVYLTSNSTGATRFIDTNDFNVPMIERNTEDWTHVVDESKICSYSLPSVGNVLIFPHRRRHDVSLFTPENLDEKRIIIRTDIVYSGQFGIS